MIHTFSVLKLINIGFIVNYKWTAELSIKL